MMYRCTVMGHIVQPQTTGSYTDDLSTLTGTLFNAGFVEFDAASRRRGEKA